MNSLRARLLAATGIVLVAFVAFTGFALERAVRERSELAQRDKLQGLIYALLGSAEITADGGFKLPPRELPEAKLGRPSSGSYAMVLDEAGHIVWRSPSLLDRIPLAQTPDVGEWRFDDASDGGDADKDWLSLAFGLRWVVDSGESYRYTLVVAEDAGPFYAQLQRFRGVLWAWLSLAAVILLILQLLILRWGLAPLRRVTRALGEIEAGDKSRIEGDYPGEIRPLVNNLNAMLASEHKRLKRYRNALGDLAHSLKTPIAVLRGLTGNRELPAEHRRQLDDQLGRVNEIVDYQLQRAAAAGTRTLAPPLALRPVVDKLVRALAKVYHERGVAFSVDIADDLRLPMDEGDLTEILGNVLDNAAKYGGGRVSITARHNRQQTEISVEDNGGGFPAGEEQALLQRGVRADTRREGQGIGLAVAAEIARSYAGDIRLETAAAGGARVRVVLPAGRKG